MLAGQCSDRPQILSSIGQYDVSILGAARRPLPVTASSRRRRLMAARQYLALAADSPASAVESGKDDLSIPPASTGMYQARVPQRVPAVPTATGREKLRRKLAERTPLTWVIAGEEFEGAPGAVREWRSFAGRFAEALRGNRHRGDDVVITATRPEATAARIAAELDQRVLRFRPDVVLLSFGPSDAAPGAAALNTFEQRLTVLLEAIAAVGAVPVLCTPPRSPRLDARTAVDQFSFAEAIRATAAEWDVPLVDHWQAWQAELDEGRLTPEWFDPETQQPGRLGHARMAERILHDLELVEESPVATNAAPAGD